MATVWHGVINPPRTKKVREWDYSSQQIQLKKGEEMGRFLLGSTVVLLFPANTLSFNPEWQPGASVRLGEAMGVSRHRSRNSAAYYAACLINIASRHYHYLPNLKNEFRPQPSDKKNTEYDDRNVLKHMKIVSTQMFKHRTSG